MVQDIELTLRQHFTSGKDFNVAQLGLQPTGLPRLRRLVRVHQATNLPDEELLLSLLDLLELLPRRPC